MFDEHIRNLEQTIRNYRASIEEEGLEPHVDVGMNVSTNKFMHAAAAFLKLSANFWKPVSLAFISSYFLFMNYGSDVFFIGTVR